MNDYENPNLNKDDEQPILTPEEIKMIMERRQQNKMQNDNENLSSKSSDDVFFTDFSKTRTEQNSQKKETFRVNIPAQELVDSYNDSFYSNYEKKPHPKDVPIYNNYDNVPQERYDYNKYKEAQHQEEYYSQNTPDNYNQPQKKKRKKKKGGCSSALLCLFLALVIAFVGCFGYVFLLSGKVQHSDLEDKNISGLAHSTRVKNILLLGLDKENGGISRSDTMMLLSIDSKNHKLKLTSFLRDMWVDIPGYYSSKLNASYAFGGPQLTVDTIETNFKIDIDHFVLVDFEMFEKIVDSLGGVTVDITENEARFLTNNTRVKVSAGTNTLNGEYALIYARIRKLDSDFGRTQRQRKVISSIIDEAKHSNPITLAAMLTDIMPLITTDISSLELTQLAFSSLAYIGYDIEQLQVPADNAYSSQMISGQSALVPDMQTNINNINSFIYSTGG